MDDKFFERMDSELTGWADPVARLQQAIEKDEFILYCQPILSLSQGGGYPMAEVLLRLREEESALLPPGDFLPVFEHYRMMPRLDRWVVRNTLKRLAAGSRIPRFTVNVSGETLADTEFPRFVATQLGALKVSADRLLFEIDESDLLLHPEVATLFAAACRKLGNGILIDGFGRRAVSFSVIKSIAADFIKVDGSITRKVLGNETARNKMNAVLRVSEALRFGVVAECVEDQDILTRLKALGVGYAQGFGIYQPHPIDRLAGT
jgi:EAL domain-containing protein (putative c-di-GMP-specific phosphodiesterase class I)